MYVELKTKQAAFGLLDLVAALLFVTLILSSLLTLIPRSIAKLNQSTNEYQQFLNENDWHVDDFIPSLCAGRNDSYGKNIVRCKKETKTDSSEVTFLTEAL